ncbi:MAG: 30S ribosomal protein S12 methylthiotransferase RimO, partial [Bacteroidales bacterium]|nr:30S ribosomal protein S12 methylthiotransferase RimO [Bacteroidales bacterium]
MTAAKSAAKQMTVDVISLGCSKNLVDSERLLAQLDSMGIKATHDAPNPHGDVAVINTCAFIGDAKEESIDMILGMAERKKAR